MANIPICCGEDMVEVSRDYGLIRYVCKTSGNYTFVEVSQ